MNIQHWGMVNRPQLRSGSMAAATKAAKEATVKKTSLEYMVENEIILDYY